MQHVVGVEAGVGHDLVPVIVNPTIGSCGRTSATQLLVATLPEPAGPPQ